LYSRQEQWQSVEREIQSAKQALSDSVALRLEHGRYLIRRYGRDADRDQLESLARLGDDASEADAAQLAAGFASYFLSLEDFPRAERYARIAAASKVGESNLAIHLLLFDLAF